MAVIDDYTKQLADLKTKYGAAKDPTGKQAVAQEGVELRKKAIADGVDLNAMESGAFKSSGLTSGGAKYEGQQKSAAINASASSKVANTPNMGISNEYLEQAGTLTTQLQGILDKGFHYDPNADASLQSQKVLFEQGAKQASNKAMAGAASRGILSSSITTNQMDRIEQDANLQFNSLIPQYEQNAYNRYQSDVNNQFTMLGQLNQQGNTDRAFTADQAWHEADVTGTYESPEATGIINEINKLKAAYPGMTADQKAVATKTADMYRSKLSGLGVNSKLFGANKSLAVSSANVGSSGIETVAEKQRKLEGDHWDKNYKLDERQVKVSEDSLAFQKTQAGKTGGTDALSKTTKAKLNQMLGDVSTYDEAQEWVQEHAKELGAAGIDPSDLLGPAKSYLDNPQPTGKQYSDVDLHNMAVKNVADTDDYLNAKDDTARAGIVKSEENRLRDLQSPPQQGNQYGIFGGLFDMFANWLTPKKQ